MHGRKSGKKTKAEKRAHTISTLPIQLSGEPKLYTKGIIFFPKHIWGMQVLIIRLKCYVMENKIERWVIKIPKSLTLHV